MGSVVQTHMRLTRHSNRPDRACWLLRWRIEP